MAITDIIGMAETLKKETALGAITPNRVGTIMSDTLRYINEAQIFADSLVHKVYSSEEDFLADSEHISDLTGRPMKAGQLIYIYGPDALYRYDGGASKTLLKEHALDAIPQLNELREALISLNDAKADKDGRYPEMSVGFADDLVGRGESVPAEFSFRASGGKSIKDGAARIKRLKGNSVVWNQKALFNATDEIKSGISLSISGNLLHFEGTNLSSAHVGYHLTSPTINLYAGNKYILLPYTVGNASFGLFVNGSYTNYLGIFSPSQDEVNRHIERRFRGEESVNETLAKPQLINLTQMFQAGNEPTTIEEFYARKPIIEDEYAYNEGEVIHMTAEGIKSVGDNAWDEEWEEGRYDVNNGSILEGQNQIRNKNFISVLPSTNYYCSGSFSWIAFLEYDDDKNFLRNRGGIKGAVTTSADCSYVRFYTDSSYGTTYKNDIMITLVHSGWKQDTDAGHQPYWEDRLIFDQRIKDEFPNGMKSAGTAHDVAYNDMNKGVGVTENRIEVVDMGTLNWIYDEKYGGFVGYISGTNNHNKAFKIAWKGVCVKYPYYGEYNLVEDKGLGYIYNTNVFIKDSSYTDAASFKAAMAGVLLYYELAEPTIIEYDEPFNLDYRVADFGTEQAIAEQPSTPIAADIIYQFNAVDMIREHEIEIAKLQSIITEQQSVIATMQAQLDSLISKNEEIK